MWALLRAEDDIRVHRLLLPLNKFSEVGGLDPFCNCWAAVDGGGVGIGLVCGDVVEVDVFAVGELGGGF